MMHGVDKHLCSPTVSLFTIVTVLTRVLNDSKTTKHRSYGSVAVAWLDTTALRRQRATSVATYLSQRVLSRFA
jgi:hypothetical protein